MSVSFGRKKIEFLHICQSTEKSVRNTELKDNITFLKSLYNSKLIAKFLQRHNFNPYLIFKTFAIYIAHVSFVQIKWDFKITTRGQ